MKNKFWTSDKIVSFVAIGISIFTLFIFIKQTNLIEKQNHLSVMPYVMIDFSYNDYEHTFEFYLVNYGVGPAIIDQVEIEYKGKSYTKTLEEFWLEHYPVIDSLVFSRSVIERGLAIPAGREQRVFKAGGSAPKYNQLLKILDEIQSQDFNYRIRYRSIYDDIWEISLEHTMPQAVTPQ